MQKNRKFGEGWKPNSPADPGYSECKDGIPIFRPGVVAEMGKLAANVKVEVGGFKTTTYDDGSPKFSKDGLVRAW